MPQVAETKPTRIGGSLTTIVTAAALFATPLVSQTVRGVVLDDSTSAMVSGAQVALLDTLGQDVAQTLSDSAGQFLFEVQPGRYTFRVLRIGYAPTATTTLNATTITGELNVVIRLAPAGTHLRDEPYTLAPVIVEGRPTDRHLASFERHRAVGAGEFVIREEFEKWNPQEVLDIVRRMQGFTILPNPSFGRVRSDGSIETRKYLIEVPSRPHRTRTPTECPPLIYLDGASLGDAETIDITMIPVDALGAVETYTREIQVPLEYQRRGAECGVIALWSRTVEGGDGASPFELGIRFGGGITADSPGGNPVGIHLVTPLFGPFEFNATAQKIVSLREGMDGIGYSGWQARLAGRVRFSPVGIPVYLGTGLVLQKPLRTIYGRPVAERADVEFTHGMFTGVSYGLGPFLPFVECQLLDVFRFSGLKMQTFIGIGLQL